MAATGFTPIILFNSTTASAQPTTSNLAVGELALNIPDGKLYYNKSGTITLLANANTAAPVTTFSAGSTGFTPSTATSGAITLAGTLAVSNGGTSLTTLTANNVILGNGTSAPTFVAPGTTGNVLTSNGTTWTSVAGATGDVTTNTVQTITGTKTFSGTSSTLAMVLTDTAEVITTSATAATGTINYDTTTQTVLYYTSNASANWTVNFRGSSGTSLNTIMSTGQSLTAAFLVTQGSVAYYNSAVQVDGSSVTPKWQGGTAPSAGNASSVDVYMYTIVKTGSAAFTVVASQTKFA